MDWTLLPSTKMVAWVSSVVPDWSLPVFLGDEKLAALFLIGCLEVESVKPNILDFMSLTTTSNTANTKIRSMMLQNNFNSAILWGHQVILLDIFCLSIIFIQNAITSFPLVRLPYCHYWFCWNIFHCKFLETFIIYFYWSSASS